MNGGVFPSNDVNLFGSVPEYFQGSQWDAHAELFAMHGRFYDPFSGRYVQDGGGENGYVFAGNSPNRDRVSLPDGVDNSHSFLRGLIGDENLAGAQDWQLFVGTTAVATGAVLGGYFALGAFGIVGTAGAATAATTSTLGASLSAAGSLLTYGSFGYSVGQSIFSLDASGDLLADSASLGIDALASATSGRVRGALLAADGLLNLGQGIYGAGASIDAYRQGDYVGGTLNLVGAGLGFGSAGLRGLQGLHTDAGKQLFRSTFADTGIIDIGGVNVGGFRIQSGLNAVPPTKNAAANNDLLPILNRGFTPTNAARRNFGAAVHQDVPAGIQARYPDSQFRFNVGPGQTGPDVEFIDGVYPGFDFADLKPRTNAGLESFQYQIGHWPEGPAGLFFYDPPTGNIDFDNIFIFE